MNTALADVVIVGTGASGLTAAVVAHDRGSNVAILEKSSKVGGATSVSAGDIWIPNNHRMQEVSSSDSQEKALKYLLNFKSPVMDETLIESYVKTAPKALAYLDRKTPVRIEPRRFPDYHAELEGGNIARTVGTALFDSKKLGGWADRVRASPVFSPISFAEIERKWGRIGGAARADKEMIGPISERISRNIRGLGSALSCMLFKGCLDRGIVPFMETRAQEVLKDNGGRVIGIRARARDGSEVRVLARRGVVLATGGFDWNDDLRRKFLMFPWALPLSPPCIDGDGLRMGIEAGADIVKMPHAFWAPAVAIPGEQFEGKPLYRFAAFERIQPHSIVVNRQGKRFTNEAANYHDFILGQHSFETFRAEYSNVDCWMIFDQTFRDRYIIAGLAPNLTLPNWISQGESIGELARKVGVASDGLEETVSIFNTYADKGRDPEFSRGEGIHDQQWSDPDQEPNSSLGRVEKPAFYALRFYPGLFGTMGGLKIDSRAHVIDTRARVIPRLYACGNIAGHPFAPVYPASGSGLGNAITFGFIAGSEVAEEKAIENPGSTRQRGNELDSIMN